MKAKEKDTIEEYHKKYKEIRNQTLNQCKQSKQTYFQNLFLENA